MLGKFVNSLIVYEEKHMSTIALIHICIEGTMATVCFFAASFLMMGQENRQKTELKLAILVTVNAFLLLFDTLAWGFRGVVTPAGIFFTRFANYMTFVIYFVLLYLALDYLGGQLEKSGASLSPAIRKTAVFLLFFSVLALSISQFSTLFYYFDEQNLYHRSSSFWFLSALGGVFMLLVTYSVFFYRKSLSRLQFFGFLSYLIFPGIALVIMAFLYGYALVNLATTFSSILVYAINILERNQLLHLAKVEAEEAGRAKERFLANMSHEIRTPINGMLGMNEMILREAEDPQIREYADGIRKSGRVLLGLVNDILDFTKIESGSMHLVTTSYRLSEMLRELERVIQPMANEKGLEFREDISAQCPEFLEGDETRVRQVIMNLLTNAVKYTEKGTVTLKISALTGERPNETLLRIDVTDTGMGIRKEEQTKLFESFYRLEEERNRNIQGTGLGLAITKDFVDLMGGQIRLTSTYGEGSTFVIMLPQKIAGPGTIGECGVTDDDSHQVIAYVEEFRAPGARVLSVDDNEMNLKVVSMLLKKTQILPIRAKSGEEALELMREQHFDLILLDHMMPEMDGMEVLRTMREEHLQEGVPVIALTANALVGARDSYVSAGFDDYLSKPVLGKSLEEMLLKWLPENLIVVTMKKPEEATAPGSAD